MADHCKRLPRDVYMAPGPSEFKNYEVWCSYSCDLLLGCSVRNEELNSMILMGFIQLERFYDSMTEEMIIVMTIALVQEKPEKKISFSI